MKGSIQKKGNIFYAVIALNGKRKWFRGGDTKKSAQKILNEKLPEIDQGTYQGDIQRFLRGVAKKLCRAKFKAFYPCWV